MDLLDQWPKTEKRKAEGTFVFGLSHRQIHRIVAEAAQKAGVQDDSKGMPGTILYRVCPDVFPTYWFDRVKEGRMDRVQAKSIMGHDVSSDPRDRGSFKTERLLSAYRKVERRLAIF